ncbi:MAG TPA: hypothetical protein VGJ13_05015 [Pseudonocardiaceae bacterium]
MKAINAYVERVQGAVKEAQALRNDDIHGLYARVRLGRQREVAELTGMPYGTVRSIRGPRIIRTEGEEVMTLAAEQAPMSLESRILQRTLRVPALTAEPGDATVVARQFDVALLSVGFTLSAELREHLSAREPGAVIDAAVQVLGAVRHLVGDHVQHNAYFRDFPFNVPDTVEFWMRCLSEAIEREPAHAVVAVAQHAVFGGINLLDLPTYGSYQHSYSDLLAAHDELTRSTKDRVTVLHLGDAPDRESQAVFLELAASTTPLSGEDRDLLAELALLARVQELDAIPVRENLAIINAARLGHSLPPQVDTVTDVLRMACAASGGDVTLADPTRFVSLRRPARRSVLRALHRVVREHPAQLADVSRHREAWKRLGERLHPHEHPTLEHAAEVFAVARGERIARSLVFRVEHAFDAADPSLAVSLLAQAPGLLLRNTDRVLRCGSLAVVREFLTALTDAAEGASGRVLLSLREHLANRSGSDAARVFVNRAGRSWVTPDQRAPLDPDVVGRVIGVLDRELGRRMPAVDHLVVDPAVLDLAVPLSGKSQPGGFGVMPRGSLSPVEGGSLRFFVHWCQRERRTDYDLSVLLLDGEFRNVGQLSWTGLRGYGGTHSGDITDAPGPGGASEFIDLHLPEVPGGVDYIVPQVHLYSGEAFTEAEESLFGFMTRDRAQKGMPFEPRSVRMKSELRVPGRVALPLVFIRGTDGWTAKWMHLHLTGMSWSNRVETNRISSALLARGVVDREYLTVKYLADLMALKAGQSTVWAPRVALHGPVRFIGLERPEGLPEGSVVNTLGNLHDLIPR